MAGWIRVVLALSVVAASICGTTGVGRYSIMCLDWEDVDWKGDIIPTKGIYLNNYGVIGKTNCGLNCNCGEFRHPTKIDVPYFTANDFYDLSVSVWFQRRGRSRRMAVLASNGDCASSAIQITSPSDCDLEVTVRTKDGSVYQGAFTTPSQSTQWRHVVVTVQLDRVTEKGWVHVYFDGTIMGSGFLPAKMPVVCFPMIIGANACPVGHNFVGYMDQVSFARYTLKPWEVMALFNTGGQCISK
ncbi:hypothetical protein NP493_359g06026 [Ridgeia piscesae]|uniref:Uncharacterized protein n=1 Tax=Ridgeia piscesae TaxID=27915 RepID=A0AAD9L441_RIDPI|nr:hypothetical protein NP493_359g06026 [Ridgeia piscesae]